MSLPLQDMSLTSKYDHTHHALPEPLLGLASLKSLSVRFPSLNCLQNGISRLTALQHLRIEGLQGTLVVEPGAPCILLGSLLLDKHVEA